ncbi:efflux RND transporter periplasmic adaptor subunit [Parafilimonas sp.]|uniref:efflux RND transporter periplasmic adaptor subunit n=1 Tax=Parafilimonas sp. TaxID=1969739 RepID=UPI0039E449D2
MHTTKKLLFFQLLSSVCLLSCHSKQENKEPKKSPPPVVDVMIAQPQAVSNIIEANGTVVANEFVELHPEATGRITYLNVPEGKYITKGTVIARINSADLEANLNKSKAALKLAQDYVDRLKPLLAVQGVNQADYDAAANTVISTEADIQYTQALIDKTVVCAPFDGVVGLRQVSLGAYVSNTDVIATMQQVNNLKMDFTLPEEYGKYISTGSTVQVTLDAIGDTVKHKAAIIAIEPQANTVTRNLKVRTILQDKTKANPGAFAKVYLARGGSKQSIVVPTNCIIPSDINKQLILVKNGNAQFTNVTTGMRLQGNVEITKGVEAGDTVIVTGVLFAKDKKPVHVRRTLALDSLGN